MSRNQDNDRQAVWDPAVLRAAREARGWSIAEAARQLRAVADHPLPGHDSLVKAWMRWEHGTEPSHQYRPLLLDLLAPSDWPQRSGIVDTYPRRALVPPDVWTRLLRGARQEVGMLHYAGLFLLDQQPDLLEMLTATADAGGHVRLLLGEPDCLADRIRTEEVVAGTGARRGEISAALDAYRPLAAHPAVELRLHTTVLPSSIYRFDDQMIVTTYVAGLPDALAPTLHLHRGELFTTYTRGFEQMWTTARPAWQPA